jgi:hypothetical protein
MGWFSDSINDPTGLATQWSNRLKGYAGQPDYGYAQGRAPAVNATFDAAQKRYQDSIVNREKNAAAEGGWGMRSTNRGPAASRISKGFQELQTDRAMAELGQQNQWQQLVGSQMAPAISATQKTTPGIASQFLSPFIGQAGREFAPGLMKDAYKGLRGLWGGGAGGAAPGWGSGTLSSGFGAGEEAMGNYAQDFDWGSAADIGASGFEGGSALADAVTDFDWSDIDFDWFS